MCQSSPQAEKKWSGCENEVENVEQSKNPWSWYKQTPLILGLLQLNQECFGFVFSGESTGYSSEFLFKVEDMYNIAQSLHLVSWWTKRCYKIRSLYVSVSWYESFKSLNCCHDYKWYTRKSKIKAVSYRENQDTKSIFLAILDIRNAPKPSVHWPIKFILLERWYLTPFPHPVIPLSDPWKSVTGKGYSDVLPPVMKVSELSWNWRNFRWKRLEHS